MRNMLEQFWQWLGKNPEKYAEEGLEYLFNHMEYDFPGSCVLLEMAYDIVKKDITTYDEIYDLLTEMAIEHESEMILNFIVDNSSDEQIQKIVAIGITHLQPNARWQLAEILYRRRPSEYTHYLKKLSEDAHPYVRQRANNCIELLKKESNNA